MQFDNVKSGSVVKIWHGSRGHDYVIAGENLQDKRLLLIKATCLNEDGTIHASTSGFHKTLKYSEFGGIRTVSGISRILGTKDISAYDFDAISGDNERTLPTHKIFKASALQNNMSSVTY